MKGPIATRGLTRRQFLRRTAVATGGALAVPTIIPATALGSDVRTAANGRMNVGIIGLGGRGRRVMDAFLNQPDTQVVAVCDCYRERYEVGAGRVNEFYGNTDCAQYLDMLELLDRKDIDVVLIATGDNWHTACSIMAARAGKDIYCEKPMSVALTESRALSDTMTRLGRIFQCGTQRRSIAHFRVAAELARSGKLGNLQTLYAEDAPSFQELNYDVLPEEPLPPKEDFDWDRWLGPAAWRPYNHEYPSRGYWSGHVDFSGGSVTEWGSHTVDLCQWANNSDDTGPVEYWHEKHPEGDRWIGQYTSGTKVVVRRGLRFGSCPVRYEGDEGWVEVGDSGQIETHPKSLLGNRGFEGGYPPENHVRVFLDCVQTREQPNAHAEVAHRSISVCHVMNLVKRLGRPIKWNPETETCIDDEEANRLLSRAYREPWYL